MTFRGSAPARRDGRRSSGEKKKRPPRMSAANRWMKTWNLRATGLTQCVGSASDPAALKFLSGCSAAKLKHNSATSRTISGKHNSAVPGRLPVCRETRICHQQCKNQQSVLGGKSKLCVQDQRFAKF